MTPEETAERLLDAQVRFLMATLTPAGFAARLDTDVDALLVMAARLRLGEVVTREQICAVAVKYAAQMRMPGSIPEIASEIADRIYNHPAQEANALNDVVPARHIEELTAKILELPGVRERLLQSPMVLELAAEWVYRILLEGAGDAREMSGRVPGLGPLLGLGTRMVDRLAPDAAVGIEERVRAVVEAATRRVLSRARGAAADPREPWVHETVVELWREQSTQPMSSLRELLGQDDLEELLVLLYDLWLSLRETAYIQALIAEGVDFFFDKYEGMSLADLLEEFGIGRADLIEEAQRFAPPILELIAANGMLEALVRARLAPFFRSEAARALLDDGV